MRSRPPSNSGSASYTVTIGLVVVTVDSGEFELTISLILSNCGWVKMAPSTASWGVVPK